MNRRLCIYAEYDLKGIRPVYYELLSKADELAKCVEDITELCAIVLGHNITSIVDELRNSGVDKVYFMDHEKLDDFNIDYYSAALTQFILDYSPYSIFIGATAFGEELAPTVGLRVKTGVAAHCTDLKIDEKGELIQIVPAFGGKVLGEIYTPDTYPKIASIKPGIFTSSTIPSKNAQVVAICDGMVTGTNSSIRDIKIVREPIKGIPLEEAEIVFCGGFGMGSKENWILLDRLANMLGGAVGCTRPALDEGWIDKEDNMIGTSGKSIRPKIYIGAGISGATHHICGMKDSDIIISINKDKDADIFIASDFKVVGDAKSVLEAVILEIEPKEERNEVQKSTDREDRECCSTND